MRQQPNGATGATGLFFILSTFSPKMYFTDWYFMSVLMRTPVLYMSGMCKLWPMEHMLPLKAFWTFKKLNAVTYFDFTSQIVLSIPAFMKKKPRQNVYFFLDFCRCLNSVLRCWLHSLANFYVLLYFAACFLDLCEHVSTMCCNHVAFQTPPAWKRTDTWIWMSGCVNDFIWSLKLPP